MKTKMTLALAAILTSSAFAAFQAPLPEFKNEKQLAEWRAEMAAKNAAATSNEDSAFYIGKPYVESSGSYAFKYRSYNPELARWTSEDPSGFPDGANGNIYAPVPTNGLDFMGLYSVTDSYADIAIVDTAIAAWTALGYTMAPENARHSIGRGADRNAPDSDVTALKSASAFTDQFNKSWFDSYYGTQGAGTYSFSHVVDYGKASDLGNAYGNVAFAFTTTVTTNGSGFKYSVDFSTPSEYYDFSPTSWVPQIAAFHRLQDNGYASVYLTSANFTLIYE